MKKLIALCIVTTVVSSVTGCGCARRLRDFVCRGSRCGAVTAIAAPPIMAAPPMVAAPMAYDPGCGYPGAMAGYDPGCGFPGAQTYGYAPSYDSGWTGGGAGCESCSGGYSMPSYGGGMPVDNGYLAAPSSGVDPGPATGSGAR